MSDDQAAKDVRATFAAFGPDAIAKIAEALQSGQSAKDAELTRLRDRNAELEKERDERPWIEKQQSDIMRKMDIELFGWKCQSNEQTNLRILAEARIASLEATVSTLIEALLKLISVIDKCPSYEAGAGGQTIESQLRRTLINRVPALAVEEAREIALAASDTVVREPSKKGDNDGVE